MALSNRLTAAALALGFSLPAVAQQPAAARPAFKGIWEPVSYGEDVSLNGVYFVTADEGWVTGGAGPAGGVLLHTRDGGQNWEVALGDPGGSQHEFYRLRFVDQLTGFVAQSAGAGPHKLLRTVNGSDWTVSGTLPQNNTDYRFVSATEGVTGSGDEILRTTDAGRTWKPVYECVLRLQVEGITRQARCHVDAFYFASPLVGYAIGGSYEVSGLYVFRTEDGGETWSGALVVPGDENGKEGNVFFTNEQTGYVCTQRGSLFGTTDAGQTWTGLPGASCEHKAQLLFADPEVGWAFHYHSLTYTTDGGRRWVSRQVPLPALVQAFSLPRRDRAYAVGEHGMVFRYRVVPVETTVAHAVASPAMPGIPTTLATEVTKLEEQFSALDGVVQSAPESPSSSPGDPSGRTDSASGAALLGSADAPPSAFVAGCCGKRLSTLELLLKAVGGIVPDFLSKYKNLNLLAQGLRTASVLPETAASLKSAFRSFRSSTDRAAATTALTEVKTVLAGLKAAVDTALQKPQPQ